MRFSSFPIADDRPLQSIAFSEREIYGDPGEAVVIESIVSPGLPDTTITLYQWYKSGVGALTLGNRVYSGVMGPKLSILGVGSGTVGEYFVNSWSK